MTSPLEEANAAAAEYLKPSEADAMAVDYMMAVVASQFLEDAGDPLWGWLIAPPGSMKTELLRTLFDHPTTVSMSSLTPQSLVSGYERDDGVDPSLMPQLDGKILVVKEFTSVLQMPEMQARQIFGDLRGIYDGSHAKGFGNVGIRRYKSRFSLLAAVTPAVDHYTLVHMDLGERFIAFRMSRDAYQTEEARKATVRHVLAAMDTKDTWRKELQTVVHDGLSYCENNVLRVTMPDKYIDDFLDMSDLLATMRTQPDPDGNPQTPEVATRIIQQLAHLARGHAAIDGRQIVNEDDMNLVARVVADTMPMPVFRTIQTLYEKKNDGGLMHQNGFTTRSGVSPKWWNRAKFQYKQVGVIRFQGDNIGLTDDFRKRLSRSRLRSQIE